MQVLVGTQNGVYYDPHKTQGAATPYACACGCKYLKKNQFWEKVLLRDVVS
jgi:hypothetical protein